MKYKIFEIKINLENSAFDGDPRLEIIRILQGIFEELPKDGPWILADSNGNNVGTAKFKGR